MASKSYHLLLEDDNVDIDKNGAIIRYDDTFVKEKRNHRLTLPRQSAPTKTKKRARKTIPSSFSSMSSISSHKNTESLVKVAARPSKRYVNLELCMTLTKAEYKKFRELGNIAVSSLLKIEFPLDSQDSKMLKTCKNMIFSSYPTLATRRDSWVVDELVQSVFANKRRYFRQKQQKEFNSKAKQESAKNKHADMIFIEETDSEEEKTESEKETSQDDKRSTSSVADLSEETSTSENEYSDDEEEVNTESGDKDIFEEIEFQIEITKEKELKNTTEEENKNLENTTEEIKNLENTTEEEIDCGYEIVVSLPTTDDENENENDNSAKRRRVQI